MDVGKGKALHEIMAQMLENSKLEEDDNVVGKKETSIKIDKDVKDPNKEAIDTANIIKSAPTREDPNKDKSLETEDNVDGIADGILVVTDPEITSEEFEEVADELQGIVDNTEAGEVPFTDKYEGNYILSCPICGGTFVNDTLLDSGEDACPICCKVPDAFVVNGKIEDSGAVVGQEETQDDIEHEENLEEPTDNMEGEMPQEDMQEEPLEDEEEENPLRRESKQVSGNKLQEEKKEERFLGPSDDVIADSKAKGLYTESEDEDGIDYEYLDSDEDLGSDWEIIEALYLELGMEVDETWDNVFEDMDNGILKLATLPDGTVHFVYDDGTRKGYDLGRASDNYPVVVAGDIRERLKECRTMKESKKIIKEEGIDYGDAESPLKVTEFDSLSELEFYIRDMALKVFGDKDISEKDKEFSVYDPDSKDGEVWHYTMNTAEDGTITIEYNATKSYNKTEGKKVTESTESIVPELWKHEKEMPKIVYDFFNEDKGDIVASDGRFWIERNSQYTEVSDKQHDAVIDFVKKIFPDLKNLYEGKKTESLLSDEEYNRIANEIAKGNSIPARDMENFLHDTDENRKNEVIEKYNLSSEELKQFEDAIMTYDYLNNDGTIFRTKEAFMDCFMDEEEEPFTPTDNVVKAFAEYLLSIEDLYVGSNDSMIMDVAREILNESKKITEGKDINTKVKSSHIEDIGGGNIAVFGELEDGTYFSEFDGTMLITDVDMYPYAMKEDYIGISPEHTLWSYDRDDTLNNKESIENYKKYYDIISQTKQYDDNALNQMLNDINEAESSLVEGKKITEEDQSYKDMSTDDLQAYMTDIINKREGTPDEDKETAEYLDNLYNEVDMEIQRRKQEESKRVTEGTSKANLKSDGLWVEGTIDIDGTTYEVSAKVFLVGSDFGINKGPVSKLYIGTTDNDCIVNYDRGWDVRPSKEMQPVYKEILKQVTEFRKQNPYEVDESLEKKLSEAFKKPVTEGKQYKVSSYYDIQYKGLEDSLETDDYDEAKDFIWDKLQHGNSVEFEDTETGETKRYRSKSAEQDETAEDIEDYLDEGKKVTESSDSKVVWSSEGEYVTDPEDADFKEWLEANGYDNDLAEEEDEDTRNQMLNDYMEMYNETDNEVMAEDWEENVLPMIERQLDDDDLLILLGSAQTWRGTHDAGKVCRGINEFSSLVADYDIVEFETNSENDLSINLVHHDGTHVMDLYTFNGDVEGLYNKLIELNIEGFSKDEYEDFDDAYSYNDAGDFIDCLMYGHQDELREFLVPIKWDV